MSHHVLLLGGHGKIAQLLTPLLLKRSWAVTSVVRNPDHVSAIKSLATSSQENNLNVLVRSLEDIKSDSNAQSIIDEVKPTILVWSAGAGGQGGPSRTNAIDRDAAVHFIHAAAATSSITRFLLVSYIDARRGQPSWWSDAAWAAAQKANDGLGAYYAAKLEADEELFRAGRQRKDLVAIDLRPGTLSMDPAGKVELGRTKDARGKVSREAVAKVADGLLAAEGMRSGWLDLLDGEEEVDEAVRRVVKKGVDASEGEPVTQEK